MCFETYNSNPVVRLSSSKVAARNQRRSGWLEGRPHPDGGQAKELTDSTLPDGGSGLFGEGGVRSVGRLTQRPRSPSVDDSLGGKRGDTSGETLVPRSRLPEAGKG